MSVTEEVSPCEVGVGVVTGEVSPCEVGVGV